MKESYFWTTIRTHLPEVHWARIENVAGSGIPDLNGCYDGKEVWIELKMFRGNQIHVRKSQLVWATKRLLAKGDVVLMARKNDEIWVIGGSELIAASMNPAIARSTGDSVSLTLPVESSLKIFHKPFDWEGVRHLLFGK